VKRASVFKILSQYLQGGTEKKKKSNKMYGLWAEIQDSSHQITYRESFKITSGSTSMGLVPSARGGQAELRGLCVVHNSEIYNAAK
jgi:hypothetical protein